MDKRKPHGYWKRMSDEELENYLEKNCAGLSINEVRKGHYRAYTEAKVRGIIDKLIEQEVLSRMLRKRRYFRSMSDETLIDYISKNHKGKTISDFANSEDNNAYRQARIRGLINYLVKESILIREVKPKGFFKKMSNDELEEHIKSNFSGMTLTEFRTASVAAYGYAKRRDLLKSLIENGIILQERIRYNVDAECRVKSLLEGYVNE